MTASSLIRTTLEVERKFTGLAVKTLTLNGGNPPFQTLIGLRPRTFTDVYYDKSNLLSSNGVWLRQRDGQWQAKIKQGGDFSNSKFEELSDPIDIARHLRVIMGRNGEPSDSFGLEKLAALTTVRHSWLADGEFTIVLDRTDFGHTVGEVELQCSMQFQPQAESIIAELKKAKMKEMDDRIARFMNHYSWAFCPGMSKGKLTAFFERAASSKSR